MKKIPTIFIRGLVQNKLGTKYVTQDANPLCDWVFAGEGVARQKLDGICVKVDAHGYWKRQTVHPNKPLPVGFVFEEQDSNTGYRIGWVKVGSIGADNYHMEAELATFALRNDDNKDYFYGTYELIGPKINGNPEKFEVHWLVGHSGCPALRNVPLTFEGLKNWLADKDIEGIVFYHPDGRLAKIKKSDFGLKRV